MGNHCKDNTRPIVLDLTQLKGHATAVWPTRDWLYMHFLGPNNVLDNMASMAEDKLKTTVYNGEQHLWDFSKYINVHKSQH